MSHVEQVKSNLECIMKQRIRLRLNIVLGMLENIPDSTMFCSFQGFVIHDDMHQDFRDPKTLQAYNLEYLFAIEKMDMCYVLKSYKFNSEFIDEEDKFDDVVYDPSDKRTLLITSNPTEQDKTLIVDMITNMNYCRLCGSPTQNDHPECTKCIIQLHSYYKKACEKPEAYTCSICMDDPDTLAYYSILPCRHTFHVPCILKWLQETSRRRAPDRTFEAWSCPMCRLNICYRDCNFFQHVE
jgi:hypothetical protein